MRQIERRCFCAFLLIFMIMLSGGCGGSDSQVESGLSGQVFPDDIQETSLEDFFGKIDPSKKRGSMLINNGNISRQDLINASNRTLNQLSKKSQVSQDVEYGEILQKRANADDSLNARIPKRNVEKYGSIEIVANRSSKEDQARSSESDLLIFSGGEAEEWMTLFKARRYQVHTRSFCLVNNTTDILCTNVTANFTEPFPEGIEVEIEAPGGWQNPPGSQVLFNVHIKILDPDVLTLGTMMFKCRITPYSPDGAGIGGDLNIYLHLIESSYEVDIFERGVTGAYATPAELSNLIGDARDPQTNGYLNSDGVPLTEEMVAQIPDKFRKAGLALDGNSRLMVRVTSLVPGANQDFDIMFPFLIELGFSAERLDGSLITVDNGRFGELSAKNIGDGVYQATFVIVPPEKYLLDDGHYGLSWPEDDLGFVIEHYRRIEDHGWRLEDYGLHDMKVVPPPLLMMGGLWGNNYNVFGRVNLIDPYETPASYIMSLYSPNSIPAAKTYVDWDALGGLAEWNAEAYKAVSFIERSLLQQYRNEGIACTKVDMLVHSMGGLFAWNFANNENVRFSSPNNYKNGYVRRVLSFGTPYAGTPWANWAVGDISRFKSSPWSNVLTRSMVENRSDILSFIQKFNKVPTQGQLWIFNRDLSGNFEYENIIPAIQLAAVGSSGMQALHQDLPKVPMFSISGNARQEFEKQLDLPISLVSTVNDFVNQLGDNGYSIDNYHTVGDLPLSFTAWQRKPNSEHIVGAQRSNLLDTIVLAVLRRTPLPDSVTGYDLLAVIDMLFGTGVEHDLIVPEESSKWIFGHSWEGITGSWEATWHNGLNKYGPNGEYIAAFFNPLSIFKNFNDVTAYSYNDFIGPPNSWGQPLVQAKISSLETDYEPPITISIDLSAEEIEVGDTLVVTGMVPFGIPDGTIIRIDVIGLEEGSVEVVPGIISSGEFTANISFGLSGLFNIEANLGNISERTLQFSEDLQVFVKQRVRTPLRALYFAGPITADVGEDIRVTELNCVDFNYNDVNVSNPRNGVTYEIQDTSIATVRDGIVKGVSPGSTQISAVYKGYIAFTDVIVSQ